VPAAWLDAARLEARAGGERFQCTPGSAVRSLKKQFQAAGVAAWKRDVPLVYARGQLVFVPGLGIDARVPQVRGSGGRTLRWVDVV
jgi:tRNA(Ile)-lysidine synthase